MILKPANYQIATLLNSKKINRHRVYDLVAGAHQKNVDHRHCQPPTLQRARKNPHYNYRSVFADKIECHIIADDASVHDKILAVRPEEAAQRPSRRVKTITR